MPDVGAALTDLKATRRRRNTGRVVAAGLAMAVVASGWAVASRDSGRPEPVDPTVRNGALVVVSGRYLLIVEPGEKELTRPTNLDPFTDLAFTADGEEMVYQAPRRQLVARDVMTGEERLLGRCDPTTICRPALSPDEQWLAIPADDSIVLQHVAGAEGPRLVDLGVVYDVSWSPDGSTLAVSGTEGLQLLATDGSSRRTLVPYNPGRFAFDVAWSPDGSSIAFIEVRPHEVGVNSPRRRTRSVSCSPTDVDARWPASGTASARACLHRRSHGRRTVGARVHAGVRPVAPHPAPRGPPDPAGR